jgi:TolB-like protein
MRHAKSGDTEAVNVPEADVRAEVERVLASKGFANAGRLSRLLRYVVDKTLAGEADQLKEYAVGIEVFDRDNQYDPRLDSIVRVEAGRLRSRLDEYYNGEGANATVRITLPRGAYVAQFAIKPEPPANPPINEPPPGSLTPLPRGSWASWPLTLGLVAAVAAMVVWLAGSTPTPAETGAPGVAVLAFSGSDTAMAARITENVTSELARLGTVSVASHTSAMQFAGTRTPLRDIAAALNVDFVLEASIDEESAGLLAVVRIVDTTTDRKVWVADYRGAADDARAISQRIAFDVGVELVKRSR